MFHNPSTFEHLLPGEPSPEALHREEYYNERTESTEESELVADHVLQRKARLLRAQVLATVGRYFA